jgi:hypothetical protein
MEYTVHFATQAKGRKVLRQGEKPQPVGRIPRVARVLALAHHFDDLIAQGAVKDYAEIARLAQMSRARVAQILTLKFLAPEIQEQLTELPMQHGKDPMSEKELRRIAMIPDWAMQRQQWQHIASGIKLVPFYHHLTCTELGCIYRCDSLMSSNPTTGDANGVRPPCFP